MRKRLQATPPAFLNDFSRVKCSSFMSSAAAREFISWRRLAAMRVSDAAFESVAEAQDSPDPLRRSKQNEKRGDSKTVCCDDGDKSCDWTRLRKGPE